MNSYYPTYRKATISSGYDSDAQAFFTATGITDTTIKNAIDALVVGLKADSLWTLMKAIYPFVGGTAALHKWNLKDPRDLDAAYRIVWNGTLTHDANGVTGNGSSGYGDTKFYPNTNFGSNNHHLSLYMRTNGSNTGNECDFGVYETISGADVTITCMARYNNTSYSVGDSGNIVTSNRITNNPGTYNKAFINSRTSTTSHKLYRNGSQIGSTDTTSYSAAYPSPALLLFAVNVGSAGTPSAVQYSPKNIAGATIGDGLDDTQSANLTTRWNTFQTSLSRNV